MRVRPKLMTVATMLVGLVPLLWATGSGADVMKRIAAPMVGGLVTSAFLTLEIIPVVYTYWRQEQLLWERLAPLDPGAARRARRLAAVQKAGWIGLPRVAVSGFYVTVRPGWLLAAPAAPRPASRSPASTGRLPRAPPGGASARLAGANRARARPARAERLIRPPLRLTRPPPATKHGVRHNGRERTMRIADDITKLIGNTPLVRLNRVMDGRARDGRREARELQPGLQREGPHRRRDDRGRRARREDRAGHHPARADQRQHRHRPRLRRRRQGLPARPHHARDDERWSGASCSPRSARSSCSRPAPRG